MRSSRCARWITKTMKEGLDLAELPCINCAAGKYKAAADVNIDCNQCEAAPSGIAFQRFLDQYDNCLQPGTGRDTNDHCVVCGPRQRCSGVCRTSCDLYHSSKSDGQHEWRTEEAPRVVASSLLLRGPLLTSWVPFCQLGHSILSNSEWRTDACGDSGSGWEGQIPFYIDASRMMMMMMYFFFCPGAASSTNE
jgi:hypothetical protein